MKRRRMEATTFLQMREETRRLLSAITLLPATCYLLVHTNLPIVYTFCFPVTRNSLHDALFLQKFFGYITHHIAERIFVFLMYMCTYDVFVVVETVCNFPKRRFFKWGCYLFDQIEAYIIYAIYIYAYTYLIFVVLASDLQIIEDEMLL